MTFEILRADRDYRRMPWKNGGGETVEIARFPAGGDLSGFDWRISMATVAEDGPFSVFPGIDRTLAILDGAGMELVIGGEKPALMTEAGEPLAFPADSPTDARLVAGPITDLNLMTRRGVFSHRMERRALPCRVAAEAGSQVFVLSGAGATVIREGQSLPLGHRDCVVLDADAGPVDIAGPGPGSGHVHVMVIRPA